MDKNPLQQKNNQDSVAVSGFQGHHRAAQLPFWCDTVINCKSTTKSLQCCVRLPLWVHNHMARAPCNYTIFQRRLILWETADFLGVVGCIDGSHIPHLRAPGCSERKQISTVGSSTVSSSGSRRKKPASHWCQCGLPWADSGVCSTEGWLQQWGDNHTCHRILHVQWNHGTMQGSWKSAPSTRREHHQTFGLLKTRLRLK